MERVVMEYGRPMVMVEGACGMEFDEFEAADGCCGYGGCLACAGCSLLAEGGCYMQEPWFPVDEWEDRAEWWYGDS
jgi:hypothetical protein